MPRYAARHTVAEFTDLLATYVSGSKDLLEDYEMKPENEASTLNLTWRALLDQGDEYGLFSKVWKDWSKIKFSAENMTLKPKEFIVTGDHIVGLHTLPSGLTYLGVLMGGDWEEPLFGIIYHDGQTFRGYIPNDGNIFNKDTKTAFGNDEDKDFECFVSHYNYLPEFLGKTDQEIQTHIEQDGLPNIPLGTEKILDDIQKRITVR